jgi:3-methyladenine DNA glycosylase Tag
MMSASPSLVALAKSYEITRERAPRSLADLPKSTPQAEAFAKELTSQGYRFVGPTSVYAFMQNVGVLNDHVHATESARRSDVVGFYPRHTRPIAMTSATSSVSGRTSPT